jgi:hypothetical protein
MYVLSKVEACEEEHAEDLAKLNEMIARKRRVAEEKSKNVEEKLASFLLGKKEAPAGGGPAPIAEEETETMRFDEKSLGLSQIVEKAKLSGDPFNNPNK